MIDWIYPGMFRDSSDNRVRGDISFSNDHISDKSRDLKNMPDYAKKMPYINILSGELLENLA